MSRQLLVVMVAIVLGLVSGLGFTPADGAVPPRPNQPRPDIFPSGSPSVNLQDLNPVTVNAKRYHGAAYRLVTAPGCNTGTIAADMRLVEEEARQPAIGLNLYRDDVNYNFTIFINCGAVQIRNCGSVNVYCLPYGFPFNADVSLSDILSGWFPETRLSILLHEVVFHAVATWNEQYALCGSSCGFAPSPNWRDVMNTGEQSRHGIEEIEIERWHRTMWEPIVYPPAYVATVPCGPGSHPPCIGMGFDGSWGIWFCGVPYGATVVSLAADDGFQGDGYWLASRQGQEVAATYRSCSGFSSLVLPPLGVLRCWYVLGNNEQSYPAWQPWQLAGCIQG